MGFVSYTVKFLKKRLNLYESLYKDKAPNSVVHEAKVFLKFLDDMFDEGYKDSYNYICEQCDAVNRLKSFIALNDETPFVLKKYTINSDIIYKPYEYDLEKYITIIEHEMNKPGLTLKTVPDIFYDILSYSKYIFNSLEIDTAYCFLLRDTLLPYLAFKKWDNKNCLNIYPMFISRRFFSFFENKREELYNFVQDIIFEALGNNVKTLEKLKKYVKNAFDKAPSELTMLINAIKRILSAIPQKNIMIIESGYIGTMPLLLSAIDDRVDFRMFTTIPYFYELYKDKFFTKEFEKIRLFETIQCQDALFKLSSVSDDGYIKVVETADNKVKDRSYAELHTWNHLIMDTHKHVNF